MTNNIKIFARSISGEASKQLEKAARTPAFENARIRIMPDVHTGRNCVIGFTAATALDAPMIPNILGGDLGCGIFVVELGKHAIPSLSTLDRIIRQDVPCRANVHDVPLERAVPYVYRLYRHMQCKSGLSGIYRVQCGLGTLGGGNHFIEVDEDEAGCQYLIIHSGSRNLGERVTRWYQNMAVQDVRTRMQYHIMDVAGRMREYGLRKHSSYLVERIRKEQPPDDLAYLEGTHAQQYFLDMQLCADYAARNRECIARVILKPFGLTNKLSAATCFHTVHNVTKRWGDGYIVRKGAVSATSGERVLIALNSRDGCILGRGRGNPDYNCSAPHGAGRAYSRREAKWRFGLHDYIAEMQGVYTTSVGSGTLDECPMAYKAADDILPWLEQTVRITKRLKPIYNFKPPKELYSARK